MPSTISAGTTAGTAIAIAGDTTGNLAFQTNGTTTAMTIDTSQNVGIGTTTSSGIRLAVSGGQSHFSNDVYLTRNDASGPFFGSLNSVPLRLGTSDTERMRIDSSGNVGIGATSLAATFTVNSVPQGSGNQGIINRIRNNYYVGYASRDFSTNTNIFQVGPFPPNNGGGGGAIVRIVVGGVKSGIDFYGSVYEFMIVKTGQTALTINTVHNFGATGVTSTVSGNYAIFGLNFSNYSSVSMTFEVLCGAAQSAGNEYILTPTFV